MNFTGQEHGLSGLDFPHKLVVSAVEEIPFFKNNGGVVGRVLGGWRAGATYTLSSGQPYTAVQFSLSCNAGGEVCAPSASDTNPYDPAFNAEYALPDGSLRPFLGSGDAPVQSVGIFAKDICASDNSGILCGNAAITPSTLISLNQFNNGFTGTKLDSSGRVIIRQRPSRARLWPKIRCVSSPILRLRSLFLAARSETWDAIHCAMGTSTF